MPITYNSNGFFKDGEPWFPVMGEFQYSRNDHRSWKSGIAKMKSLGINTVASYVIWIHHEEERGKFDFTENNHLRAFLEEIKQAGMLCCLRVGPWVHAEVRNGGFPDWLMESKFPLRCNHPQYLSEVKRFFLQIYEQCKGLFYEEGGPIYAIQAENEYITPRPFKQGYGDEHINTLIAMLKEIGFRVPVWFATGWGKAAIGDALPVWGAYSEAPWEGHGRELSPRGGYVIADNPNDADIASDTGRKEMLFTMSDKPYPFITVELGTGVQVTKQRRPIICGADCAAIAFCKLASGASALGYYVFHGGINPIGKLSSMQEYQDGSGRWGFGSELPELDYDFQAAISQYGRVTEMGKELKLWNYFVQEFADISQMPVVFPEDNPIAADDLTHLRYSVRRSGAQGYVFFNDYVRHYGMPDFVLNGKLAELGILEDPENVSPIILKNKQFFLFPYHMPTEYGTIRFINATPFCRLNGKYVFWAYDVSAVYIDASQSVRENILVLSREEALDAYKFTVCGREVLLFSNGELYEEDGRIVGYFHGEKRVKVVADVQVSLNGWQNAGQSVYCKAGQKSSATATVQCRKETEEYSEYTVSMRYDTKEDDRVFLSVDFNADRIEFYIDDKKVLDKFYTGVPAEIELSRYGFPSELSVRTYPLREGTDIYVERANKFTDGVANEILGVQAMIMSKEVLDLQIADKI